MKLRITSVTLLVAAATALAAGQQPVRLCEPWQTAYAGDDVKGKHVLALWTFDADAKDATGHGCDGKLEDAKLVPGGKFGGALECFRGWPVADKRHRVVVKHNAALSPKGPFTIELWVKPKPKLNADYPDSFLIDKKYVAHTDYQLVLGRADRQGSRVLRAWLGFGGDSETYYSRPMQLGVGKWHHLAFTYDAAGTGRFFLDGQPWGKKTVPGRKATTPGKRPLTIGDRNGSYYHGFPGYIDQVRICNEALEFRRAKFELKTDRKCYVRMEPNRTLSFAVTNLQRTTLAKAHVAISVEGMAELQTTLTNLPPGQAQIVNYPLDTSLRPETYSIVAKMTIPADKAFDGEQVFPVTIVARRPPNFFPVVMWGGVPKDMRQLTNIGFSHALGLGPDCAAIWKAGKPIAATRPDYLARNKELLDKALANGVTLVASLSPGSYLRRYTKECRRVNRNGKPMSGKHADICGLFPKVQKFCYNVGASMAQTYGDYPAFGAAMIHSEVRGAARPCFHKEDRDAFRKYAGIDIPPEVNSPRGVSYERIAGFPPDRVIPDNYPLYVYYKWYWKQGDGWNGLNTQVVRGLKTMNRPDFWAYHDPAVRVAKVYGSGGDVDILSQWTYSYPDPIRIGLATEELLAMVKGAKHKQQVMKMTQIIWYRSQTAPMHKKPQDAPAFKARWEIEQPGAPFITIAPMHLREALWTKIARPIRGIMYHGWGSLVRVEPQRGYRYTNHETKRELARLIHEVIRPLGPTLLQVPGVESDVALLESFASEMFARRGTFGWNGGWLGDMYHILEYAHLQPQVVYDETVVERGLDGCRVLVMADCDVITQTMADKIKAFQANGGIIVGDERLTPAIRPDILIKSHSRSGKADADKAAHLAIAAELRKQLDPHYERYVDSSNPDVIPHLRRYRATDYVFVVNDHREYGEYVGQHGIVMENGLPSDATLTIKRGGYVYDLVENQAVPTTMVDGKLSMAVQLGPCEGRVFMVTPEAIDRVTVQAPTEVDRGSQAKVEIAVVDADGQPVQAVVPLRVDVRDAEGKLAEFSGYYGAAGGKVSIALDIARNDPMGMWTVDVRELASGRRARAYVRVRGPKVWPPLRKGPSKDKANAVQPQG